ncbi:MAG: DUF1801 domain-containing protein [Turicibacter sp.]
MQIHSVDEYVAHLSPIRQERFKPIIEYIRSHFTYVTETLEFSPKSHFPVFIHEHQEMYVGIASMKGYISIYFGKNDVAQFIGNRHQKLQVGTKCIKIKDTQDFPFEDIKQGIDLCFL